MADEQQSGFKETLKSEIKSDKKFYIRAAVISLLIVIGYYLFSPYENCVRAQGDSAKIWCRIKTSW